MPAESTEPPRPAAPADDLPNAPRTGSRLAQFRLVRELGRGGMGVVYEADDTLLHRPVAVKVLRFDADDADGRRVLREARAVAKLDHPHVVRIHHIGKWADGFYLVLELMPGGSLEQRIAGGRPLPWADATRAAADAARGLAAAHDAGLVHRDVKPANLMADRGGRVKVGDFGLVRAVEGGAAAVSHGGFGGLSHGASGRSVVAGTPKYMSPEQCRGEAADERSDVYALGVTFYALLTGRPPFDEPTPTQLMFAHCTRPMPDPRRAMPDVPDECAVVVRRATEKAPADRYQTAEEFLDALARVPLPDATTRNAVPVRADAPDRDEGEPEDVDAEAEAPVVIRRARPAPTRRQWVRAAVAGGVAVPLIAGGVVAWRLRSGREDGPVAATPPATGGKKGDTAGPPNGGTVGDPKAGEPAVPPKSPPAEERVEGAALAPAGTNFPFGSSVAAVAFSDDGTLLAAGGETGGAVVWDIGTGKVVRKLDWGDVRSLAFTRYPAPAALAGTTLIGGGARGRLWWTRKNDEDGPFIEGLVPDDSGLVAAVARQGTRQVAFGYCGGPDSGKTRCYSVAGLKEACVIGRPGNSAIRHLRYAPAENDPTLAVVSFNGGVILWDSNTGARKAMVTTPQTDKGSGVAFHPAGKLLAVALGKGPATATRVAFWNLVAGRFDGETRPLAAGHITALAYSPDGKTLAIGDDAGAVNLYENGATAPARTLAGGKGVRSLAFRPAGGRWLATGDSDGTVRLWDLDK